MSFFFADTRRTQAAKPKAAPRQRLADIPVTTLRKLGCSVCPRDKDEASLRTPKMRAHGSGSDVMVLMVAPTKQDDDEGALLSDKAGREVERAIGRRFFEKHCCSMSVVQCAGDHAPSQAEVECCRPRGVQDVEDIRPLVIVTVGDEAMRWATGIEGATAMTHRGTLFAARIGRHACWVFPVIFPQYVHKKDRGGGGEFQTALEHDLARLRRMVEDEELPVPRPESGPYDAGVEVITGQEPGDMQRLESALADLVWAPRSALDIETNRLRPFMHKDSQIVTAAVGTFERTVAFPLAHPDGWGSKAQQDRARRAYYEYLLRSGRKACHNLGFEMEWTAWDGAEYLLRRTEWDDTMASAYVLDPRPGTKSLEMQTTIHFGFNLKAQSRVDPKRIMDYPLRDVLRYNGMDTKWTNAVRDAHEPLIRGVAAYPALYEDLVSLAPTLVLTTAKGLPVDQGFADAASKRLRDEMLEIEGRLRKDPDVRAYERRHGTFSPTNPDHLLQMLKDIGRPEVYVTTRKGGVESTKESTSEEILVEIGAEVPACGLVLEHRSVSKLKGTYVDPTASGENVCPDGMIRSSYNSMRTITTRLSADDPAVQNWPKRKHKWVRAMVGTHTRLEASPGKRWFVALDYGQIEFRVVGMASEDPTLVKYCWTGYDVHKAWALRLVELYPEVKDWVVSELGVDWDEKGIKALRQEMKNKWVFPQLFGSSTHSCAVALSLPDDVTEDLAAEFWDEFRTVKKWHKKVLDGYSRNLYVETLDGARRGGAMSPNEAINMPIQGTAASIVKRGMDALSRHAEAVGDPELQPSLNVHDDLSTIMQDSDAMAGKIDTMARIMCEHRFDFINVPLLVEASIGPNWADLDEIKVYKSHELFNIRNPYA